MIALQWKRQEPALIFFSFYRFITYKLPKLKSTHDYVSQGIGYVYMDSETNDFRMPDKPINSSTSAVGHTLQQIYHQSSLGYIMYNDEDATGTPKGTQELLSGVGGKAWRRGLEGGRDDPLLSVSFHEHYL